MRTTMTLNDDIYEEVRRRAFENRQTLGEVINELIARGLAEPASRSRELGAFAGRMTIADDFDDTPEEVDASLDEAIATMNRLSFGNGASIFTSSGAAARQFVREMQAGMLGVNIGVPAPMALFSFSGWNHSFFGDLHVQGIEGIMFYTRQKCVLSRWDSDYVRAMGW